MEWATVALIAVLVIAGLMLLGFVLWACMAVWAARRVQKMDREFERDCNQFGRHFK